MNAPDSASVAELSDRQLARRLGQALVALRKVEGAARPTKAKTAAAREAVEQLRVEMGGRITDGRWQAWEALGVDTTNSDRRPNGQGTVWHDRKRDRFIAELTVNGVRARTVHRTRANANSWLRTASERAREGRDARESKWTVASWLDHLAVEVWPREGLSPATLRNHRDGIDRWWKPEVGSHRLATLQPEDVDRVIGNMVAAGLSPNSIRIATAPLLKGLRRAEERGHVTRNVARLASKPKLERRRDPHYLDPDESRAVLHACAGARFGDAVALSMLLGLRRGEVLGLAWDRVNLDGDRPTVTIDQQITATSAGVPVKGTKTGRHRTRTIVLPRVAVEVLGRRQERQRFEERAAENGWRNEHNLVFTTLIGTPIHPRNFAHAVEALTESVAGRRVGPHALRHTTATLLHEAGVSMKVAQTILGHASSLMTEQVYTHVLDEQHDRAASALDALLTTGTAAQL